MRRLLSDVYKHPASAVVDATTAVPAGTIDNAHSSLSMAQKSIIVHHAAARAMPCHHLILMYRTARVGCVPDDHHTTF